MAKKILINEVERASKVLKNFQIEHFAVQPVENQSEESNAKPFIVVLNKDVERAKKAISEAELIYTKVKSARKFEKYIYIGEYFEPRHKCTCRNCGKTFEHRVKEAVWCSPACKKEFRNAKRNAKISAKTQQ